MRNPTVDQIRSSWQALLPNPEHRKVIAGIMAATIKRANVASPGCWMVSYKAHRPRLNINVGRAFTISLRENDLAIILDTSTLAEGAIPETWRNGKLQDRFKVVPEAAWIGAPVAEVLARWDQIKDSYFSAVDKVIPTSSVSPWWRSHAEAALQFVRVESGESLPDPLLPTSTVNTDLNLLALIDEFVADYPNSPKGLEHTRQNLEAQASFRQSFANLKELRAASQDITDEVLLKLLPHARMPGNLEHGAWTTPAPVLNTGIKKVFEASGRASPGDWPKIAGLIMDFFEACEADPDNLNAACQAFVKGNPAKGFQAAILSAGLSAMNPDAFCVINKKPLLVVEQFSGIKHTSKLLEYPETNADVLDLVEAARESLSHCDSLQALAPSVQFDMFTHWFIAVRPNPPLVRYWKISPGEQAFNWEECRKNGVITMGWKKFGDISGLSRDEFDARAAELAGEEGYSTGGTPQLWTFANDIQPGDRILANHGMTTIVGIGTVTGDYVYVPDVRHGHQLPVKWDDVEPYSIPKHNWTKTIIKMTKDKFDQLVALQAGTEAGQVWLFQANPKIFDLEHKLRVDGTEAIDSWKVSALRETMKSGDTVLLWQSGKKAGIYAIAVLVGAPFEVTEDNADDYTKPGDYRVALQITSVLAQPVLRARLLENETLAEMNIIRSPMGTNFRVTDEQWKALQPLIMVAPPPPPPPSIEDIAAQTGFTEPELTRWINAIHRKGQAVLYGPPGTGKTYVADLLARHLAGTDGLVDLVQFHPAYTYEDFLQGLRPVLTPSGGLDYRLVPGRFLEFCAKASRRNGPCVLILDEINRANLARVFGELMYLLEYRNHTVPLAAGGELTIPENVRIIGTMNTADRSIALVDHALRRRFAFIHLRPQFAVLEKFHQGNGYDAARLVKVLMRLNQRIEDPHYEVGISFFLRKDLGAHLEDIWRMEIEPYLEEYFFDQAAKAREFSWDELKKELQ